MFTRQFLFLTVVCIGHQLVSAQSFSSARASIGTEIIEPVGTEQTGKMIRATIRPGKENNAVTIGYEEIQVNKPGEKTEPEQPVVPLFRVITAQQVYSISLEYEPYLFHLGNTKESIKVEMTPFPAVSGPGDQTSLTDRYSIGTRLGLGPDPVPGNYTSAKPCRVTVHFN